MARFCDKSIHTCTCNAVFNEIRKERRRRNRIRRAVLILLFVRLKFLIHIRSILCLLLSNLCRRKPANRSCRRLFRNKGWWDLIFHGSDDRFKKTFQVTRVTFNSVLNSIRQDIEKDTMAVGNESPLRPDFQNGFAYLSPSVFRSDPIPKVFKFSNFRPDPIPKARLLGFRVFRFLTSFGPSVFGFSKKISKIKEMAAEREKTFNNVKDEYEQHRMVQRDREAKYRAANREILREKAKTHYANNREEILRKKAEYLRTIVRKSTNKTERDTLGTERKSFGGRLRNAGLRNRKNLRSSNTRPRSTSESRKKKDITARSATSLVQNQTS